jgi:glycosyltransferase involved in cell wall biosynthesis
MTLRVLFLAERFPPEVAGGGELSAAMVAKAVAAEEDVEVRVITQGDGGRGEVDGVPVSYSIPRAPAAIPDDVSRGELLTARAAPLVARALKEADLVHSVSPRAIPAAVAAAKLARKPATSVMNDTWSTCFTHLHVRRGEYCPECFPKGIRQCIEDIGGNVAATPLLWRQFRRRIKAVRALSGVVAVCPAIERLLRAHDVKAPIAVIPLPMDFGPWEGIGDQEPEPGLVAFIGRMASGKGVLESIEAFATAAKERPGARMLFVGDGPLLDDARRRAEALDMSDRIEFPGWVPPEELPTIYGRAQVVLAPFMRVEAIGRVVLETAAAGRPVVTTDIGGGAEVLHDTSGAGRVVRWDDLGQWSEALGEILDDPSASANMGREARIRLERLYGPKGVGPRYVDFWRSFIEGSS